MRLIVVTPLEYEGGGVVADPAAYQDMLSGLGERLESRGLGSLLGSIVGENSPAAKALDALGIDNERLLLIGLLLVLMNEKADRTLIIALVYLLL